ncbi:MAG: glycerol kinase GlpK [Alphaproteobacteria bacterium]|nr:glycerol kinase GlpK [Alphaproteobacteria bacterium]
MKKCHLLAIDQGTTSTRAILFDDKARPLASHAIALRQIYPANGWVEHDAAQIWRAVQQCAQMVLKTVPRGSVAALGITNQRETSLIWDASTGKPLHNAIVWQDRRGADRCSELKAQGWEDKIAARTGLLLDPYFSATKLEWLLRHIRGAKARAAKGEVLFGTIDTWLIWKLSGGKIHATDVTNASRTMLFNLKSRDWDADLLKLFGVPRAMLPEVKDSVADFGAAKIAGHSIPILGVAGDQQAASFGQACFSPGDVKATFGTGLFALVNTGKAIVRSRNRLLTTALAGHDYAVEGSIFIAGAVVQWLRDAMGIIPTAAAVEALAKSAGTYDGLYFVPAFTGLGAPYWDPQARGAIFGLTRDMGKAEVAAAALDAVCYQMRDLMEAMAKDKAGASARVGAAGIKTRIRMRELKVDGGMVANDFFCQRLADLTGLTVARPRVTETTVLGAALLAAKGAGLFRSEKEIAARWALDRRFHPRMKKAQRDDLYRGWSAAVARVRSG